MEISFHSHLDANTVIATKFCTCHDSCAVVTCAKICCDLMVSDGIMARPDRLEPTGSRGCAAIAQYMVTSSMDTFSVLLTLCAGNSPVTGEFPTQTPVTRSFDVFFDLRLE